MPNIYERHITRPWVVDAKTASIAREFVVTGTSDETEVYELALAATTVIFDGLVRKTIKADPQGGSIWFVNVDYGTIDPQQAVDSQPPEEPVAPGANDLLGPAFSFDTTGATVHITQSKGTRSKTDAGGTTLGAVGNNYTLDNERAIGITKDKIEGCDIHAPQFAWQLEVQRANCTGQYLLALFALTGKVNYSAPFYGFPIGSVLYLGASGRFTQKDRWSITHKFACSPSQTDLRVSSTIVVPLKRGWDYMWVGYEPATLNNQIVNKPVAAYVEYVYDDGDFSTLEIGG